MKRLATLTCVAITLILSASAAEPQDPLFAVIKEILNQQTTINENQSKIDAKLVTVAEALRLARIYASRGGH